MSIEVTRADPQVVLPLRDLYRREMNCQIVLDSWHGRGWTDPYLCHLDGHVVGYGSVGGEDRRLVTEFYIFPQFRGASLRLFREFLSVTGATEIEVQSNDLLLTLMLYDCATEIESPVILFNDCITTHLLLPGAVVRKPSQDDRQEISRLGGDHDAEWLLEVDGEMVATGGILCHYNVPYGDLYMEVMPRHRRRGYGSFLIQEMKRICYEMGRVPSARCNAANHASRATLQRAGMLPCARVLTGSLESPPP